MRTRPRANKVLASELCYTRWNKYPVTEGHLLIIPNRHVADYFLVTPDGHDREHEHGFLGDRAIPSIDAAVCGTCFGKADYPSSG